MALHVNTIRPAALLCLGDCYRLNGPNGFTLGNGNTDKDALDARPTCFRAGPSPARRSTPTATPAQRAYALYRAINCYG